MGQIAEHITAILEPLIACPSLTPEDAGCQALMLDFLKKLGFRCQIFNCPPVANFYAEYGDGDTLLVFAGHTDVVSIGEPSLWKTDPFTLTLKDDHVYGRGVADMKGSLAAMLVAAQRWVAQHPNFGRLGFLITSGEEGDDYACGTPYVMEQLYKQGNKIDFCIVGEPSSSEHFPPTSLQITHVHAGGEAGNIIPQDLHVHFNIRFSPTHTAENLKTQIMACFARHHLEPNIEWTLSGNPFLTQTGKLLETCQNVIRNHTLQSPECSTSGGTSDGRFIAPYGVEVVELGPSNQTIHQINESVALGDLVILSDMYYDIISALLRSE